MFRLFPSCCRMERSASIGWNRGGQMLLDTTTAMHARRWGATAATESAAPTSSATTLDDENTSKTAAPKYKTAHQGRGNGFVAQAGPTKSSCSEEDGPVAAKPLTALQRRMLAQKEKAAFALTPSAIYRVKTLLQSHQEVKGCSGSSPSSPASGTPIGIRIGVKKRGCSGYSYTVNYEYADSPKKPNDTRVDQGGVSIFVDGDALFYVIGTHMDFTVNSVEEKFTFSNPNQKYQCGCGESFMPFDV